MWRGAFAQKITSAGIGRSQGWGDVLERSPQQSLGDLRVLEICSRDHLSRVRLGEDQRLTITCLLHRKLDNLRDATAFQSSDAFNRIQRERERERDNYF